MCIRNHSESGQPCGFEPCEAYKKTYDALASEQLRADKAEAENAALRQERDALIQVSADVCPDCGWAMKFPDEPCRNCEVVALRKVVEKADVLANHQMRECEACSNPCMAYGLARMYQEARHAK